MTNRPAVIKRPDDAAVLTDELSDSDLEQVVGGLSRTWHLGDAAFVAPAPSPVSVTPLALTEFPTPELARRVAI